MTSAYMLMDDILCNIEDNRPINPDMDEDTKGKLMELGVEYW